MLAAYYEPVRLVRFTVWRAPMRRMTRRYEIQHPLPPPTTAIVDLPDDPQFARVLGLIVLGWSIIAMLGVLIVTRLAADCGSACNAVPGSFMRALGL